MPDSEQKAAVSQPPLFSYPIVRSLVATIATLIVAIVITVGSPSYIPLGGADNLAVPVILFPFIWTALFLFTLMTKKFWKANVVLLALFVFHAVLIYLKLS